MQIGVLKNFKLKKKQNNNSKKYTKIEDPKYKCFRFFYFDFFVFIFQWLKIYLDFLVFPMIMFYHYCSNLLHNILHCTDAFSLCLVHIQLDYDPAAHMFYVNTLNIINKQETCSIEDWWSELFYTKIKNFIIFFFGLK